MSEVNKELLTKHVAAYLEKLQGSEYLSDDDANERRDRQKYYESWTKERLLNISEEEFFETSSYYRWGGDSPCWSGDWNRSGSIGGGGYCIREPCC